MPLEEKDATARVQGKDPAEYTRRSLFLGSLALRGAAPVNMRL